MGGINGGLGEAKFNTISIRLDSGASSSIIKCKPLQKLQNKIPIRPVGLQKKGVLILTIQMN